MLTLVTPKGECARVSVDQVQRRLGASELDFWLDIEGPDQAAFELLETDFHFHPLTVEDVRLQNQRPKLEEFPGYAFAVLFTAEERGGEVAFREHHLYLSPHWLVTVRHEAAPAVARVLERIEASPDVTHGDLGFMKYLVVNELVESLFPVLDDLDERIDRLEDGIIANATPAALSGLTGLKHQVTDMRRILGAQRDVFQRLLTHSLDNSGGELSLYWRDVYEHLVRQYEGVDSLRDLVTGAMDVYLSTVSNRLNTTMKQLTVIASVFLPLTFLTGFFGMNFAYLVGHITAASAFAAGAGLMLASLVVQLVLFRRRGWI